MATEKKKHQRWKKRDLIAMQSKYTNRAVMKKEKVFPRHRKDEHFLYTLPLQIMPTMRQKKKKSIFKLFHPQNKTTENFNLRIEEDEFEDMQNLDDVFQHFGFNDEKHI